MATYKEIQGFNIQNLTADPDNANSGGQIYYNSTSGQFKVIRSGLTTGTWASGANMNTARYRMQGGMGVYNNAYAVGGAAPNKANVENYNGTSWSETTDVPSARADVSAGGTATAGIALGGTTAPITDTLEWDGSSWTAGGAFPVAIARAGTFGTQTAMVAVGGASPSRSPADQSTETLHYNGTSWTDVADYPTILANGGGSGTQTDGMIASGYTPAGDDGLQAHTYNGSSWTEISNLNTNHREHGFAQAQSGTSVSLHYGGPQNAPDSGSFTEQWNGTSWTEVGNLSTSRSAGGSAGTNNNALYFGGYTYPTPGARNITEEWTESDFEIKTMTTS
jgi:hypothetical protein